MSTKKEQINLDESSVKNLLDFCMENNIDYSDIHTGKGFRSVKKARFKRVDLVNLIKKNLSEIDYSQLDLSENNLLEINYQQLDLPENDLSEINYQQLDLPENDLLEIDYQQLDLSENDLLETDYQQLDLSKNGLLEIDYQQLDLSENDLSERKIEKLSQFKKRNIELKIDYDNTTIKDFYNFALEKDASLSYILKKCYGFITDKTNFVKLICQLLNEDEQEYLPPKINTKVKQDLTSFEVEKNRLFDNIYKRFLSFINQLCLNNKTFDYIKFAELRDDTAIDLYNFVVNKGEDNQINQFTLSNILSELKSYLIPKILDDNKNFPNNIILDNFIDFHKAIKERKEIKENLAKKREITNTHVNKRQSNMLFIECAKLLDWCFITLKQLKNKDFWNNSERKIKAQWSNIALALMLVTGRRSSEIMSSASFEKIDTFHVNFIGQLKGVSYSQKPIKIPVLIDSELVILGIQWLEYMDKREKSNFLIDDDDTIKNKAKKAHTRFSRYLNEDVKNIFSDNVIIKNNGEIILKYDDGKVKNRVNCHLLRQIYSQIAYQIFYYNKRISKKKHFALAEILGHEDNEQNAKKASENYDSDFEITDYDLIAKMINY